MVSSGGQRCSRDSKHHERWERVWDKSLLREERNLSLDSFLLLFSLVKSRLERGSRGFPTLKDYGNTYSADGDKIPVLAETFLHLSFSSIQIFLCFLCVIH